MTTFGWRPSHLITSNQAIPCYRIIIYLEKFPDNFYVINSIIYTSCKRMPVLVTWQCEGAHALLK
jgi:hypothetical protein